MIWTFETKNHYCFFRFLCVFSKTLPKYKYKNTNLAKSFGKLEENQKWKVFQFPQFFGKKKNIFDIFSFIIKEIFFLSILIETLM
jgi:hypothetical protein